MGIRILLDYVKEKCEKQESIDFIKLAKTDSHQEASNNNSSSKMTLVLDGETCLDRLYGGFYSDYICGGQWCRMENFLRDLVSKVSQAKIELVVFFNGALEPQRLEEWIRIQRDEFFRINRVLQEVEQNRAQPIYKRNWIPPSGLRCALRMKLRQQNVTVVSTIDDHRQEVIAYCRENDVYGLIADDAEYIPFQPERLFSASNLKLRYRGILESKEFKIAEIARDFELNSEKLCILAALLGNYLLPDKELKDVHEKAGVQKITPEKKKYEVFAPDTVSKLAKFVSQLNVSTDLDDVVQQIFPTEDVRSARLKQSIQYYLNGTKDGFLKYRSIPTAKKDSEAESATESTDSIQEADLDTGRLETDNTTMSEFEAVTTVLENDLDTSTKKKPVPSNDSDDLKSNESISTDKSEKKVPSPVLPQVSHQVMRTLSDRHSKGLMSPYIYQILSQGEIRLPVVLQNLYNTEEIPNIHEFYKPIRRMVYAILLNLHHHTYTATKEKKPLKFDFRIKEWVFDVEQKRHKAEYVSALPVGWGVPTIQRLWFGTLQDDKRRRLRAFLTCMRSDVQMILNPDFVPQELLMAAVVLRFIMSSPKPILRKQELDAFIVTALTLESSDANVLQDLKDPICSRNVQLATMFMNGVDSALLVNDSCGAPIPWLMCCPWLFFDGKLFNHTFQKAVTCKNLQELCANRLAYVVRAERMRQAILEGLNVQFARPPSLKPPFAIANADYTNPAAFRNPQLPPPNLSRSSLGEGTRGPRSLGGSLKVAGVVTGSWGANYNMSQPSFDGPHYLHSSNQVAANNSFNNYGYRSRSAFNSAPKGKPFKFYAGKKDNIKRKPTTRGGSGRGRGRGGMTVGSSCPPVTNTDLPNGNDNDTSPTEDGTKFEPPTLNGAPAIESNVENDDNSNVLNKTNEESSSLVEAVGSE